MWRWILSVLEFAWGYSELTVLWAGIVLWEALTKTKLPADTKWQLYAGGFIGMSFVNWRKATARIEVAASKSEKPPRIFAEEPEALIAHLSDPKLLTQMQVVSYIDKWITVAGTVEFVTDRCALPLTLRLDRGQRVHLRFAETEESRLREVRQGQRLTAVCQIRPSYNHARVALENCEVIRLGAILAKVS
jgi:hypothetical protein